VTSLEQDNPELPTENLPDLTPKQRAFVKGILDGKTASDAYRLAYDCSNTVDSVIWAEASRLRSHPKVSAWLAAARKAHLGSTIYTRDQHSHDLDEMKEIALEHQDPKTALRAIENKGRLHGHYVDRIDLTINNISATLAEIAQINPVVARELANTYSIPLAGPVINAKAVHVERTDQQPDDIDEGQDTEADE
jgi:hypothetical protein